VKSSCEFRIELSGSIKGGKLSSIQATRDLSSSAQLHGVSREFTHACALIPSHELVMAEL
jgi:hypothetical protein